VSPEELAEALASLGPGVRSLEVGARELAELEWTRAQDLEDVALVGRATRRLGELLASHLESGGGSAASSEALRSLRHDLRSQVGATRGCVEMIQESLEEAGEAPLGAPQLLERLEGEANALLGSLVALQGPAPSG